MPYTIYNTGILSSTHTTAIPATGGGGATVRTWPYPDGLTAWAGDCADADPAATGGTRSLPTATGPGQSVRRRSPPPAWT